MSVKGDLSRAKILSSARKLFAKHGWSKVTMQDICNAAGISRGGLYRHYSSTEDIFAAIIDKDETDALDFLTNAVKNEISPKAMFETFLKLRISILTNPEECIENAISEFAINSEKGKELLQHRALNSIHILSEMLTLGCENGSFVCDDCNMMSRMILWSLEGIGKHNALIPLTNEQADEYIKYILRTITPSK